MCAWLLERHFGDALVLHDSASILAFEDHLSYVHQSPVHVAQGAGRQRCRPVTGAPRVRAPPMMRIDCEGTLPPGISAKDLMLHLLALPEIRAGVGVGRVFEKVGATLLQPACGACGACANCGPGASTDAAQVTVSAVNRNFPGRSGPGQVWLAGPATVAASAMAGELVSFADLKRRHG